MAFVVSAAAFLTVMAAAGAPSVLLSRYQRAWGFSDAALTVAFAVYALALLAALLVCGSVSDHLGRRPVAVTALLLSAVAMVLFLRAQNIEAIVLARAVQGGATGAATTVFSSSIVEFASDRARRAAEIVVSMTTAGGLGIGIVLAGSAVEFSLQPTRLVFAAALIIILTAAVVLAASPETMRRRASAGWSLLPQMRVSVDVRRRFGRLVPGLAGIWMSAGLVLGLGASLSATTLHLGDGMLAAIVVAAQPLTATATAIVLAPRISPGHLLRAGLAAVMVGVGAEGVSFLAGDGVLLVAGAVITGMGFGAFFSGVLRDLLPGVSSGERSGFFAAFYVVGYLAYGLSAIAAGFLSNAIGLRAAAMVYAGATVIVTAVGAVACRTSMPIGGVEGAVLVTDQAGGGP